MIKLLEGNNQQAVLATAVAVDVEMQSGEM